MNKMSESDWAYLAGIIDGEGCIGLRPNGGGGFELSLEVKSTHQELPRWIQERTGLGKPPHEIRDGRECEGGGKRQPYSRWRVFGRDAMTALVNTLPWLRVKRTQAEIAIAYRKESAEYRRHNGSHYHQRLQDCNGRRTRLRQNGLLDPAPTENGVSTD